MFRNHYGLGPYCSSIEYVDTVEPVAAESGHHLVVIDSEYCDEEQDSPECDEEPAPRRRGRRPQPQ